MRTKILLLIGLFMSVFAFGQGLKVPAAVQDAFKKLYPNATEIKWDKEGKNEYEANFKNGETKTSIVLDKKGKLTETETVIKISELPEGIAKYVEENYKGFAIIEAARIEDNKGIITFEAEISKDKVKKDVMFDKDGKPLKKKK